MPIPFDNVTPQDIFMYDEQTTDEFPKFLKRGHENTAIVTRFPRNHQAISWELHQAHWLVQSVAYAEVVQNFSLVTFATRTTSPFLRQAVDFVIVTYNSSATIRACLWSLLSTMQPNDRIIVVDNASQDNTQSVLSELAQSNKRITVHSNPVNLGFSEAVNQCVTLGIAPYVCLVNPDIEFTEPGWIDSLLTTLNSDETIGAVGPKSDYVAGLQNLNLEVDADRIESPLLIGFCLLVRRSTWLAVGGLDANLFLGHDDLDLSWRIRLMGLKLVVDRTVFVHHEGHISFKSLDSRRKDYLLKQSANILEEKIKIYASSNRQLPSSGEALWNIQWYGPSRRLSSIIIPCWDNLEKTRLCVESLIRHTPLPIEVIFINNGSTDGTYDYLENLRRTCVTARIRVIHNNQNLGFAKAINQGMAIAEGDYLIWLNNDIVVTPFWLSRILALHESIGQPAIIGPMANNVSGLQAVQQTPHDLSQLTTFSKTWFLQHSGQIEHVARLVGFLFSIPREIFEQLGGVDISFGIGNFEDDDYCLRAAVLGVPCLIAKDVFVHHFGSSTFAAHHIDYNTMITGNLKVLCDKWHVKTDQLATVYSTIINNRDNYRDLVYYPLDTSIAPSS